MITTARKLVSSIIAASALGALVMFAGPALRADSLTISIGTITVTPGEVGVVVAGDITNASTMTVNLDTDQETVPMAVAGSISDADFFNDTPPSLGAGVATGPVDLFTFDVLATATPGIYTGSFAILQQDATGAYDPVGSTPLTIDIVATPEPSTLLLLFAGLLVACLIKRVFFAQSEKV